jgi:hypothetical protein
VSLAARMRSLAHPLPVGTHGRARGVTPARGTGCLSRWGPDEGSDGPGPRVTQPLGASVGLRLGILREPGTPPRVTAQLRPNARHTPAEDAGQHSVRAFPAYKRAVAGSNPVAPTTPIRLQAGHARLPVET